MAKIKQKKEKESTKTEMKENKKSGKKGKQKEEKKVQEAGKDSGKVLFANSIKAKLLLAILVPVCFIVFLGITSYSKSANSLNFSYKESSETSISMTSEYLYFIVNTVRAEYNQYINNAEIDEYVSGKCAISLSAWNSTTSALPSTMRCRVKILSLASLAATART